MLAASCCTDKRELDLFGGEDDFETFKSFALSAGCMFEHQQETVSLWCVAPMGAFYRSTDTCILGRKTYDLSVRFGMREGYAGKKNYVFSRTLSKAASPNVSIVNEDVIVEGTTKCWRIARGFSFGSTMVFATDRIPQSSD